MIKVELLNPQPGYYEINPDVLWEKVKSVIKESIKGNICLSLSSINHWNFYSLPFNSFHLLPSPIESKLKPTDITGFGISTQRGTFITWNPETQEYYHNFITWKDLRANNLVERWNNGITMKAFNFISYVLYLLTRNNRFLVGSYMKLMNVQMTARLAYEIQNNLCLREAFKQGNARIDLLDSWILHKLR